MVKSIGVGVLVGLMSLAACAAPVEEGAASDTSNLEEGEEPVDAYGGLETPTTFHGKKGGPNGVTYWQLKVIRSPKGAYYAYLGYADAEAKKPKYEVLSPIKTSENDERVTIFRDVTGAKTKTLDPALSKSIENDIAFITRAIEARQAPTPAPTTATRGVTIDTSLSPKLDLGGLLGGVLGNFGSLACAVTDVVRLGKQISQSFGSAQPLTRCRGTTFSLERGSRGCDPRRVDFGSPESARRRGRQSDGAMRSLCESSGARSSDDADGYTDADRFGITPGRRGQEDVGETDEGRTEATNETKGNASFSIGEPAPADTISLRQGESTPIPVAIVREREEGEITLSLDSLPEGSSAKPVMIRANQSKATLTLKVGATVPTGRRTVTLRAETTNGEERTERLTLIVAPSSSEP